MSDSRIVQRGMWFVPQKRIAGGWEDFTSDEPGDPWMGLRTLQAARDAVTAGPVARGSDTVIEEI